MEKGEVAILWGSVALSLSHMPALTVDDVAEVVVFAWWNHS